MGLLSAFCELDNGKKGSDLSLSAGKKCRYDGNDNYAQGLLEMLEGDELIPFCPEDAAFGSPVLLWT